jgi:hypothetical protein
MQRTGQKCMGRFSFYFAWMGYISWHPWQVACLSFTSRFGPVEAEWEAWHVTQLSSAFSAVAATQTWVVHSRVSKPSAFKSENRNLLK